jgi:hypothetical protein
MVSQMHYSRHDARSVWGEARAILTVTYSAECASAKTTSRPTVLMPLLVLLFIVSYSILTALVFEQGQTIESQRGLIREMLKDSTQLATLKGKLARDDGKRVQDKASVDHKSADPGAPAAGAKGPDAKGSDKEAKRHGKSTHSMKEIPQKPAADLEDVRRSTSVI